MRARRWVPEGTLALGLLRIRSFWDAENIFPGLVPLIQGIFLGGESDIGLESAYWLGEDQFGRHKRKHSADFSKHLESYASTGQARTHTACDSSRPCHDPIERSCF
jgi:hypothetical protein